MVTVKLGNTGPITTAYVPTDNEEEAIRREGDQLLKLERTPVDIANGFDHNNTVTTFRVSEDSSLLDALAEISSSYRQRHSDDPPEWIESDDETLATVLAAEFKCQVGRPDGWEGLDYDNPEDLRPDLAEVRAMLLRHWPELEDKINDLQALKTNAGQDFQAKVMADTSSTGTGVYAAANYIALSTDATAPAATDTTLTGELVGAGLARVQGTYAHTAGTNTYTVSKQFTSSDGTARTINKIGIFNAASVGTLVFETAVTSPPTLVSGDQLTITETVTM